MKTLLVMLFILASSLQSIAQVAYNDTLEFTIEQITTAVRYKADQTAYDTVTVSLRHELCRRLVNTTGYTIFAIINEGQESLIIPIFPVGEWEIGYRGISDDVEPGDIFWSTDLDTPWTLAYRDEGSLTIKAVRGNFIGFRLIKK